MRDFLTVQGFKSQYFETKGNPSYIESFSPTQLKHKSDISCGHSLRQQLELYVLFPRHIEFQGLLPGLSLYLSVSQGKKKAGRRTEKREQDNSSILGNPGKSRTNPEIIKKNVNIIEISAVIYF